MSSKINSQKIRLQPEEWLDHDLGRISTPVFRCFSHCYSCETPALGRSVDDVVGHVEMQTAPSAI